MLKLKSAVFSLLLLFLLFLFIVNSVSLGVYSFINPFMYVYCSIILILLFSIIGYLSIVPISIVVFTAVAVMFTTFGGQRLDLGHSAILLILIQLSVFIAIPYMFSYFVSKKRGLAMSVYYPVSVIFFLIFTFVALYLYVNKIDITASLNYFSGNMTKRLISTYNEMGVHYLTTLKMQHLISKLFKVIFFLLPSIIITFSWIGLWVSYTILKKFLKKDKILFFKKEENLSLWKTSDYFILFLIAGIIISIFSIGIYKFIGYNIILLSSSVYLIQGLTIISFFLNKFSLNIFLKILVYGIIFIFANPIMIFVVMAGVFDMWFNFRTIKNNKNNINKEREV